MKKSLVIFVVIVIFLYACLASIGLFFAQKETRLLSKNTLPQNSAGFEELMKKIKRIKLDVFLSRPFLKLNTNWQNKLSMLDKIDQYEPLARELLGTNSEKSFLVVMQNNTELRPTGGIWGSYGILKMNNGKISSFKTDDTFYLDQQNIGKFDPPADIKDIIDDEWRFWNANWSPDFKNSVEQGLLFFKQVDPNITFDGVLGPNVDYLLSLLNISGPVELANHSFKLDQDNFLEKMIYEPTTLAAFESRKKYMSPENIIIPQEKNLVLSTIGKEIIDQISSQKKEGQLVRATYDALKNQNLVLYLQKPDMQIKVEQLGWGGRMPKSGNFAMIVDANFGSKLDFVVNKEASIEQIAPNKYKMTLKYKNEYDPLSKSQFFPNYRDFIRVFVPNGSTQIEQTGGEKISKMQKDNSDSLSYMSSMIVLEPGDQSNLSFVWEVPENVAKDNLSILKQPGSRININ